MYHSLSIKSGYIVSVYNNIRRNVEAKIIHQSCMYKVKTAFVIKCLIFGDPNRDVYPLQHNVTTNETNVNIKNLHI